jgi:hypothetical protein
MLRFQEFLIRLLEKRKGLEEMEYEQESAYD